MKFTLKHRDTGSQGEFVAWGIGFFYTYTPAKHRLDILHSHNEKPLIHVDLSDISARSPMEYVETLEKTTQIEALMLSNNTDLDLSAVYTDSRLLPILQGSVQIAAFGIDLKHQRFNRFAAMFCESFGLKTLGLKRTQYLKTQKNFYFAHMVTCYNNKTLASGHSLHGVMKALSEQTLSDLMASEFSHHTQNAAHNLLMVSSKLAILSRVLDKCFIPQNSSRKTSRIPCLPTDENKREKYYFL